MEIRQETDYVKHHIQKVAAFFAAMRAFADHLKVKGHRVIYIALDDPENRQTIRDNILHLIQSKSFTRFGYLLPDEHRLDLQLQDMGKSLRVPCTAQDTEHFLTERCELTQDERLLRRLRLRPQEEARRKRLPFQLALLGFFCTAPLQARIEPANRHDVPDLGPHGRRRAPEHSQTGESLPG